MHVGALMIAKELWGTPKPPRPLKTRNPQPLKPQTGISFLLSFPAVPVATARCPRLPHWILQSGAYIHGGFRDSELRAQGLDGLGGLSGSGLRTPIPKPVYDSGLGLLLPPSRGKLC